MTDKSIVVRFPPSPTGPFHIGGVRTALYNYLFARQNGGKFLLRIEDTDKERSKKEFEDEIFESLKWLSFEHDGNVLKQSERTEIYKSKIQELIKKGAAYIAELQEGEIDDNKRVVRFKNPGGRVKFKDLIRGDVEMEVGDLKDFVIAKNIDEPLYHLAVVVDDIESGVTHIIRGEDHISNTPRQILIAQALGKEKEFQFAHLPLVLAEDKSKLSKRKHGEAVSLKFYRNQGYSKEAIINFMALIGWNPGGEQEIFSLEELVKIFDLSKVQKKGAIFNLEKLNWMNKEWVLRLSHEEQIQNLKIEIAKTRFKDSPRLEDSLFMDKLLKIILERIHKWSDLAKLSDEGELFYYFEAPEINPDRLVWKKQNKTGAKNNLEKVQEILKRGGEVAASIIELAEKEGKGEVLWPLRTALSGREKSPDPFTLLDILGLDESQRRVEKAIEILN